MALSRQFRALTRIAGVFASVWGVVGGLVGVVLGPGITGDTALSSAMTFALMYGTAGAISGVVTALLVARTESGRRIGDMRTWRVAASGVVGGLAPAMLFGGLGVIVGGASLSEVLPLLGLGVVGGLVSGTISGSASAAAKAALDRGEPLPQVPAT